MSELQWLLIGLVAVAILLAIPRTARKLRWLGWAGVQLILGAFVLFLVNVIGELFAFQLPINFFTAAAVGWLGLPGLAALFAIYLWIL